jgi:hypothetical protein
MVQGRKTRVVLHLTLKERRAHAYCARAAAVRASGAL